MGLRGLGYAVVTPFVEELFVRSWLLRYSDVFWDRRDFRKLPIGQFTPRSFTVVVVYFVFSHVTWEYPVALAWILLTQLWFYRRRDLRALVVVHAASNAAIFAAALASSKLGAEGPGALWFFL